MLLLLFSVDNDDYVIDSAHIQEIIPRLNLKTIPNSPHYIIGTHDLRGSPLLIIDLKKVLKNSISNDTLLTRTIILNYNNQKIGLIAENVRETFLKNPSELKNYTNCLIPYITKYIHLDGRSVAYLDVPLFLKEVL